MPISEKRRAQLRAAEKRWRQRHPEKNRAKKRAWRKKNPAKWRAQQNRYQARRRLRIKLRVFELYGARCNVCGEADLRYLQLDHVNNNGKDERHLPNTEIWRRALDHPEQYQLLCANHNWIKREDSPFRALDEIRLHLAA